MGPLETKLREAFPQLTDADFGHHATDLYVVAYPFVLEWLETNYEHFGNIKAFKGEGDWNGAGTICLDIPFAGTWPQERSV